MYSYRNRIRYSEVDSEQNMTFPALINYLQDCCTFQSEDIGKGVDYLKEHQIAWVLSSWQIVMERQPHFGEEIVVHTWPYDFKGFYGYRNFKVENEKGELLAYANSVWVYMDIKQGRPARIPQEIMDAYQLEERYPMDYAQRKLQIPDNMTAEDSFLVQREQIDTNHHVNNERYIAMAQQFLLKDARIRQMRAEYRKEAVLGDTIFPYVSKNDKIVTVLLADEEAKPYAVIEFILE